MEKKIEKEIKSIKKKFSTGFKSTHQAASMALELYLLILKIKNKDLVKELKYEYWGVLKVSNMTMILDHHVDYAIRLAGHDSELIYEEMHKLFSLCEEIEAMRMLELNISIEKLNRLNDSLKHRFSMQSKMARIAAQKNVEQWNRGYWWYADNLN